MKFNIGVEISVELLIKSRLLIQANSGGGKSYAIRKLLEETNGMVQQIVLDLEGEFSSLREKCDFLLFGKDADYPVHIKYADKIAKTLLELNVSAIVDLYELKHHERITFVKRFLDAMINAPKELWHPCLIIIDEAHLFCPEKGQAESMSAVIDICTRGRKRGFCAVLATQRLSKLHKDAAAECNNKLIGRTGLDIDMKRASEELGFTRKEDMLSLRELDAGEFYAFGPAISNRIIKFKVDKVKTTHQESGKKFSGVAPPSNKIKEALSKIKDLPEEAEKELRDLADYKKEVTSLRIQLAQVKKHSPNDDSEAISKLKIRLKSAEDEIIKLKRELQKANSEKDKIFKSVLKKVTDVLRTSLSTINPREVLTNQVIDVDEHIHYKTIEAFEKRSTRLEPTRRLPLKDYDLKVTGGALRMLKAAAMFYPNSITKSRMGAIAGLSYNSGSFGTYLATLKRNNLISGSGNEYVITEEGIQAAGDVEQMPSDLVEMWCNIVKGGASRMLRALTSVYPESMSREELGEASDISHTSGTFGTYLATLKRNGLVKVQGKQIKVSDELFN